MFRHQDFFWFIFLRALWRRYYLIVCVCKRAFGHLRTSVQSPRTHNILFRHSSTAKHNHPTVDKTSGSSLHGRDALLHVRRAPAHPNGSTRIAPPPPHTTGGKRSRATGLNCLSAECSIESLAYFRPCGQGGREQNLTAGGFTNPHQKKQYLFPPHFNHFWQIPLDG